MLTQRQLTILRMLLSYGLSNIPDIVDAFSDGSEDTISYNGIELDIPTEDEIEQLMKYFQG